MQRCWTPFAQAEFEIVAKAQQRLIHKSEVNLLLCRGWKEAMIP